MSSYFPELSPLIPQPLVGSEGICLEHRYLINTAQELRSVKLLIKRRRTADVAGGCLPLEELETLGTP